MPVSNLEEVRRDLIEEGYSEEEVASAMTEAGVTKEMTEKQIHDGAMMVLNRRYEQVRFDIQSGTLSVDMALAQGIPEDQVNQAWWGKVGDTPRTIEAAAGHDSGPRWEEPEAPPPQTPPQERAATMQAEFRERYEGAETQQEKADIRTEAEQALQEGDLEEGELYDLISDFGTLDDRENLIAAYGPEAIMNGYGEDAEEAVDAMEQRIRAELAMSYDAGLRDLATAPAAMLLNFVLDRGQWQQYPQLGRIMIDITHAPAPGMQISYIDQNGQPKTPTIAESHFTKLTAFGLSNIEASNVYETLGRVGIEGATAYDVAPYVVILGKESDESLEIFRPPGLPPLAYKGVGTPKDDIPGGPADFAPGQAPNDIEFLGGKSFEETTAYQSWWEGTQEGVRPEPFGIFPETATRVESGILPIAQRMKAYIDQYNGHEELAFLAATGPEGRRLANEVYRYGSPQSDAHATRIMDLIDEYDRGELAAAGFGQGFGGERRLFNLFNAGGEQAASRSQIIANIPSVEGTKQAYESVFRALLLTEPTEEMAASFAATIEGMIMDRTAAAQTEVAGAPGDVNVWTGHGGRIVTDDGEINRILKQYATNVQAEAIAMLERTKRYEKLYANKPDGADPFEWANSFRTKISQVIGVDEAMNALGAQAAGMMGGDYSTAVGRAAMSEAGRQSETLQDRWARAGQLVLRYL